ncbi:hypothetical protein [Schlesneria sp. DSM 10557]|uniref:hypothetical protein n=1 Tax=Schlesneria sp. DSM 10557 TaxID=3044399 RepID=UPI0035A0F8B6
MTALVHQSAALFSPLRGVGRVGSQCEYTDGGWEARLYLGFTEIVGGKDDGHSQLIGFEFDFRRLTDLFTQVDQFLWNVGASSSGTNSSFVTLVGTIDDNQVCLKIYSRPPVEAGPAFHRRVDGTLNAIG